MTYIPTKTITVEGNHLHESTDLTPLLFSFINTTSYLVVTKDTFFYTLSIGNMINFIPGLSLNATIGDAFIDVLTDEFVAQFQADTIPVQMMSGLYEKRLSVFDPVSYKDHAVHFTSVDTPTIIDDVTKKGFLDDLIIVSNHDMTHYLVAVNGVFHKTTYLEGVLYVLDGFRTIRLSGRKDILVVDTKAIGGHTIIPLTASNVTKSDYQQASLVTLTDSIAGKTVLPVIDGYFYHLDQQVVHVYDETHLALKTNKMPLIQQFRHNPRTVYRLDRYGNASQSSRKYEDPYETSFLNTNHVKSALLENADFQYTRLTAYHSFLVVFNNPDLYTLSTDILPTGTPQFYQDQSKRNLSGMVMYGCGLSPSYLIWKDPSDRKSIFIPKQDYDTDLQDLSISPSFIPTLIKDPVAGAKIFAQFKDYISA